jgi:hypothetical protein
VGELIEFYAPAKNAKWVPPEKRGKVIQFPSYPEKRWHQGKKVAKVVKKEPK